MSDRVLKIRERILHEEEVVTIHKETSADIVLTQDGRNVQLQLDDIMDWIGNYSGGSGGIGDFQFVIRDTAAEFPNLGSRNTIYVAEGGKNEGIYVWEALEMRYRIIADLTPNIEIINGGNAVS